MKLLVLAVIVLAATAIAKPSKKIKQDDDLKRLVKLLEAFQERQNEGSNNGENQPKVPKANKRAVKTTMFNGLHAPPPVLLKEEHLEGDLLKSPLGAGMVAGLPDKINQVTATFLTLVSNVIGALDNVDVSDAALFIDDLIDVLKDKIYPVLSAIDLEEVSTKLVELGIKGAIAGTTGEDPKEDPCPSDGQGKPQQFCVISKLFLLSEAVDMSLGEAGEKMALNISGIKEEWCTDLLDYIIESYIDETSLDPAVVLAKLRADSECLTRTVDLIKERLGLDSVIADVLPIPNLLLPRNIAMRSLIARINGVQSWALINIYIALGSIAEQEGIELPEERGLKGETVRAMAHARSKIAERHL